MATGAGLLPAATSSRRCIRLGGCAERVGDDGPKLARWTGDDPRVRDLRKGCLFTRAPAGADPQAQDCTIDFASSGDGGVVTEELADAGARFVAERGPAVDTGRDRASVGAAAMLLVLAVDLRDTFRGRAAVLSGRGALLFPFATQAAFRSTCFCRTFCAIFCNGSWLGSHSRMAAVQSQE